jgi:hypothetical protein
VQDSAPVRGLEGIGELGRQRRHARLGHGTARRHAFDVLEHEIVRPYVVQLTDVRMIERRHRASLTEKALVVLRAELLDRDEATEARVHRPVDVAHPAGTQERFDFVRAEARAGGEHVWNR